VYYRRPDDFAAVGRSAIALNGSFFNAERMLIQYARNGYLTGDRPGPLVPDVGPYLSQT
jgi:hypothetical protein